LSTDADEHRNGPTPPSRGPGGREAQHAPTDKFFAALHGLVREVAGVVQSMLSLSAPAAPKKRRGWPVAPRQYPDAPRCAASW